MKNATRPHHGNLYAVEDDAYAPAEKQMQAVVSYYPAIWFEWTEQTKPFNWNVIFFTKKIHTNRYSH